MHSPDKRRIRVRILRELRQERVAEFRGQNLGLFTISTSSDGAGCLAGVSSPPCYRTLKGKLQCFVDADRCGPGGAVPELPGISGNPTGSPQRIWYETLLGPPASGGPASPQLGLKHHSKAPILVFPPSFPPPNSFPPLNVSTSFSPTPTTMRKFGFSKKGDDGDDANRNALFGRKKSSPAPQSDNPYAQRAPQASDPYADEAKYANMTPYQKARAGVSQPGAPQGGYPGASQGGPSGGPMSRPGDPYGSSSSSPGPNGGGYGAAPSPAAGYSSDRYGSGGGYGGNRYEKPGSDRYNSPATGARGPGGYGGLGRADDNEPDNNRDELFSGAQERYAKQQQQPQGPPPTYSQAGDDAGGYEGYGEQRELTAEEQEDAEYQAILSEKRKIQQDSASSVNRSVQMARQANEVGQATLARLGAQGERLHNTEKHLNLASNQNKIAQDRAAELKTLNRSMFAVHVGNPFTSKQRQQKADEEVMNRHRSEREQREATRREGYAANQRMESNFKELNREPMPRTRTGKKDYGKFNLDDEDDEARQLEDQIDDGLDELGGQVRMLNMVGRAIGKEVDTQNKQIDHIMVQVRLTALGPVLYIGPSADHSYRAMLLTIRRG